MLGQMAYCKRHPKRSFGGACKLRSANVRSALIFALIWFEAVLFGPH